MNIAFQSIIETLEKSGTDQIIISSLTQLHQKLDDELQSSKHQAKEYKDETLQVRHSISDQNSTIRLLKERVRELEEKEEERWSEINELKQSAEDLIRQLQDQESDSAERNTTYQLRLEQEKVRIRGYVQQIASLELELERRKQGEILLKEQSDETKIKFHESRIREIKVAEERESMKVEWKNALDHVRHKQDHLEKENKKLYNELENRDDRLRVLGDNAANNKKALEAKLRGLLTVMEKANESRKRVDENLRQEQTKVLLLRKKCTSLQLSVEKLSSEYRALFDVAETQKANIESLKRLETELRSEISSQSDQILCHEAEIKPLLERHQNDLETLDRERKMELDKEKDLYQDLEVTLRARELELAEMKEGISERENLLSVLNEKLQEIDILVERNGLEFRRRAITSANRQQSNTTPNPTHRIENK